MRARRGQKCLKLSDTKRLYDLRFFSPFFRCELAARFRWCCGKPRNKDESTRRAELMDFVPGKTREKRWKEKDNKNRTEMLIKNRFMFPVVSTYNMRIHRRGTSLGEPESRARQLYGKLIASHLPPTLLNSNLIKQMILFTVESLHCCAEWLLWGFSIVNSVPRFAIIEIGGACIYRAVWKAIAHEALLARRHLLPRAHLKCNETSKIYGTLAHVRHDRFFCLLPPSEPLLASHELCSLLLNHKSLALQRKM